MSKIMKKIHRIMMLYYTMALKRDPKLLLFGSWWGNKFADNSKYLYLRAVELNLNAWWITTNEGVYNELKSKNLPVAFRDSNEGKKLCKKAGYYFYSTAIKDISDCYCGGAILIDLWHGIPLKKIMYDNRINNDDYTLKGIINNLLTAFPTKNRYVVSTSNEVSNIYRSAFRCNKEHILQWGQPRNDCFFNGYLVKRDLFGKEYSKVILYMPTHRNEGKTKIELDYIFDFNTINDICLKFNAIFVIKKHYYHKNEVIDLSRYSNIIDCTQENLDTQELLFNADVLITDYSSCYIDYLLLDRPILFYAYDFESYLKMDREMYFDYKAVAPGAISYTEQQFISNLNKVLENENMDGVQREKTKDFFYDKNNQGIVSDNILNQITSGILKRK